MAVHIKIKKVSENALIPSRESAQAAGYDLYACCEFDSIQLKPHETVKISTGVSMEIPEGFFGAVYARSGLASKRGLRPANCVGVIDSDYRGEIFVALHNDSNCTKEVRYGDRIAQIVITPYLEVAFDEVDSLSETERGAGGFGHTGK